MRTEPPHTDTITSTHNAPLEQVVHVHVVVLLLPVPFWLPAPDPGPRLACFNDEKQTSKTESVHQYPTKTRKDDQAVNPMQHGLLTSGAPVARGPAQRPRAVGAPDHLEKGRAKVGPLEEKGPERQGGGGVDAHAHGP